VGTRRVWLDASWLKVKKLAHAILVIGAAIPWAAGMFALFLSTLCVLAADKVWPNANKGNCWSFAGPLWWKNGGYLSVRPADGQKILGLFTIPHAIWMPEWPEGTPIKQTHPVRRHKSKWFPFYTVYFEYEVKDTEKPHNGTPL
jgi:hypothetical protein